MDEIERIIMDASDEEVEAALASDTLAGSYEAMHK